MCVATMLLFALLSGIVSFSALSSSRLCTMACCASRSPHPAGSCAGGVCHVNPPVRHQAPGQNAEAHCDEGGKATTHHGAMRTGDASREEVVSFNHSDQRGEHGAAQHPSPQGLSRPPMSLTANVLARPCQPECTAGAFGSANQTHRREMAALSWAGRPRPPSSLQLFHNSYDPTASLSALCSRCSPRAPPLLVS